MTTPIRVRVPENIVTTSGDQLVERFDVVGHATDQHPRAAPREEADRHRLKVGEDPLAQVLQRARPDPAHQVGLDEGGHCVDHRDGDECDHDQVEGADVARHDPVVDCEAGEVGGSEAGAGGEQKGDEHQRHLAAVGAHQPDHPAHLAPALILAAEHSKSAEEAKHVPHSRAISSRSSRSRWRKTVSARPCSAISR